MKLESNLRRLDFWPVLLALLVAVLVPTAAVLWLMNEAVVNQRDLARQKLAEAYRTQLSIVRDRLDRFWQQRAADLSAPPHSSPAAAFESIVRRGLADSTVILDDEGSILYPQPLKIPARDPLQWNEAWLRAQQLEARGERIAAAAAYARFAAATPPDTARAIQSEVRCLVRAGRPAQAIDILLRQFRTARPSPATDPDGRSIAVDELLLAAHLMKPGHREFASTSASLQQLLASYDNAIPAAQRLFAMNELADLDPTAAFPTLTAEKIAARFSDQQQGRKPPNPPEGAFASTGLPGHWMLSPPGRRLLAIYTSAGLKSALTALLADVPHDLRFDLVPPLASAQYDQAIPAGAWLPGWQLAFTLNGSPMEEPARRQRIGYLWVGLLAAITATIAAAIAARALRNQWQAARLRTDLVAAVSHELRTPLTGMRALVDTLLDDEVFEPVKTREYLGMIERENLRLSRLIENFLAFSRLEHRKQKFQFVPAHPEEIVRAAGDAVRDRYQAADCRLDLEVSSGLPLVRADPETMITVLLNLLDNACKYSRDDRRVILRVYSENRSVIFAVRDHGLGIAPGERKKIFRRFYQVDRRLSREAGGCGLGLSIVDFIVKAHGGSIRVDSSPGVGSTFTVSLPATS
ncbi:MAG TPA: HAMP domain-containing sensor histidine kinase [Bryobacteraceae bacterium]